MNSIDFINAVNNNENEIAKNLLSRIEIEKDLIQGWYRQFIIANQKKSFNFIVEYFNYGFFDYRNLIKTAATSDAVDILKFLIDERSNLSNNLESDISHAFEWGVSMNSELSVHFFIDNEYINLHSPGNNAILISACEGHTELMEYFLSKGAVFDIEEISSYTHIDQNILAYLRNFKDKSNLYENLGKSIKHKNNTNNKIKI